MNEEHNRKLVVISDFIRWMNVYTEWKWFCEETLLETEVYLVYLFLHVFLMSVHCILFPTTK